MTWLQPIESEIEKTTQFFLKVSMPAKSKRKQISENYTRKRTALRFFFQTQHDESTNWRFLRTL